MIYLIQYSFLIILITFLAMFSQYFLKKRTYSFSENLQEKINKTPTFNIIIISIILSIYSSYLATSGILEDNNRYAWSFLYRYPSYFESPETLLNAGTEIGFLLISNLIYYFTEEPYFFFLIISLFVTITNLYIASKISKSYTLIVFLYLVTLYFFYTTFLLKQALAVAFINIAILAFLNNKKTKYFLSCLVASTFHATALIMIPMFFILKRIKSLRDYLFFILISIFVFFFFGFLVSIVLPKVPYINQFLTVEELEYTMGNGSLASAMKGIPFYLLTGLALLKREKLKQIMYKADFFIVCSILYSLTWLLTFNMYWTFRVGLYFLLPTIVLVPKLFSTIKNSKERILYYIVFICMVVIITFRQILITI